MDPVTLAKLLTFVSWGLVVLGAIGALFLILFAGGGSDGEAVFLMVLYIPGVGVLLGIVGWVAAKTFLLMWTLLP